MCLAGAAYSPLGRVRNVHKSGKHTELERVKIFANGSIFAPKSSFPRRTKKRTTKKNYCLRKYRKRVRLSCPSTCIRGRKSQLLLYYYYVKLNAEYYGLLFTILRSRNKLKHISSSKIFSFQFFSCSGETTCLIFVVKSEY